MNTHSPTSVESDTIVVDGGIDLTTSISSATSISSEADVFESQEAYSPLPVARDSQIHGTVNRGLLEARTSTTEHHLSPSERSNAQDVIQPSVCPLIEGEELEITSTHDGSSEEEASGRRTLPGKSSLGESSGEGSFEEVCLQEASSPQIISNTTTYDRAKGLSVMVAEEENESCPNRGYQKLECVLVPPLLVPKSQYIGWKHHLPVSDERAALSRIFETKAEKEDRSLTFHDILLEHFVIYRPGTRTYYPWQVVTLDNIVSNREGCKYLLDGVLKYGGVAERVQAVEIDIEAISIDGFEDIEIHSVQNMVYLQTVVCARSRYQALECWYRLGEPSEQYRELYKRFLWVANLAKHVVDFLNWKYCSSDGSSMVQLKDFRHDFLAKLMEWHDRDVQFQEWMGLYGKSDFRVPMNRHREFVFNRAFNLGRHYLKHDLWSELMVRSVRSLADKKRPPEDTLVTPYVKHCCKSMPWSYALRSERMSELVERDHEQRATAMAFPLPTTRRRFSGMAGKIPKSAAVLEIASESISFGAVEAEVALGAFAIVRTTPFTGKKHDQSFSYVFIQGVDRIHRKPELNVIFVYPPSETICLDGYYPRGDELFLSDCCNCSVDTVPILLTDIVRLVGVSVGDEVDDSQEFFIRQKYIYAEDAICRLTESDFQCPCRRPTSSIDKDEEPCTEQNEPLSGLGLFAGCGNFDFGLEASGAIRFKAAVEIDEPALKTYAAQHPQGLDSLVLDSVNPCLSQIFRGAADLPGIGSVHFISAGSPCKGFSRVNSRRSDDKGMRNCSLVASTLSYIETFLPSYAVLENVGAMGSGAGNSGNQVIACLVGLGYQVRKMKLNSRYYKSAQNRDRLFIMGAAPNVPLPKEPPPSCTEATGLAKASSVSEGLPFMDNDDLICVSHPDHIPGAKQTPIFRELIRRVPRFPKSMNFLKSVDEKCQGEEQLDWFRSRKGLCEAEDHMAFTRLDPDSFIPTITTSARPSCKFGGGRIIHWEQHRTLTLLEARRAQGFPDEEVIIGDLPQQWAQVGNAVNRQVAMALGKAIADSWFSKKSSTDPENVVAIPVRRNVGLQNNAAQGIRSPSMGQEHRAADDALRSQITTTRLADRIHKETEVLADKDHDSLGHNVGEYVDIGDTFEVDNEANMTTVQMAQKTDELSATVKLRSQKVEGDAARWFNNNKMDEDEAEFVKEIFRPQRHGHTPLEATGGLQTGSRDQGSNMSFSQIQRREIATIERSPNGETKKPIRMIAERSIEFRTKTPSALGEGIEYISAEIPIDLETEVLVSKRRREKSSEDDDDDDDDDDIIKRWVGKRVRSRLND
jgi:DNA-cytosine methyltransferase